MENNEGIEFATIYEEATSESHRMGPLSTLLDYSKSMQLELRERQLSEDDELMFAMAAVAMFNESLAQLDEPDALVFYMQRVFKSSKFAPDGIADLSGEHQVIGHPARFIYRRIRNLPTYSIVTSDTELYSYDRPTPGLYSAREDLVLPVKAIDSVRRDIQLN
jgi:hypothetical protein